MNVLSGKNFSVECFFSDDVNRISFVLAHCDKCVLLDFDVDLRGNHGDLDKGHVFKDAC